MILSRILVFPAMVIVAILVYLIFKNDWIYLSIYVAIPIVFMGILFVLSPQIDWWWWSKYTPSLSSKITEIFQKHWPLYDKLPEAEKKLFNKRIFLYSKGKAFDFKGLDGNPEDLKAIVAFFPVLLSLDKKNFLYDPYDHLIFFPVLFPSPEIIKPHASEVHHEDGAMIFSLEHALKGFRDPKKYFNTLLYEFANVHKASYPNEHWPVFNEDEVAFIEHISGFQIESLKKQYGYSDINVSFFALCCFLQEPATFRKLHPGKSASFEALFPVLKYHF